MASSTYFRWQRRFREQGEVGLVDRRPQPGAVWNRLRPEEEQAILRAALEEPDRSSRELACWLSDHAGFSVSESSVYRVLKRHGLIQEVRVLGFPASQEYRVKTTRSNEQWQSDAVGIFLARGRPSGFRLKMLGLEQGSRLIDVSAQTRCVRRRHGSNPFFIRL